MNSVRKVEPINNLKKNKSIRNNNPYYIVRDNNFSVPLYALILIYFIFTIVMLIITINTSEISKITKCNIDNIELQNYMKYQRIISIVAIFYFSITSGIEIYSIYADRKLIKDNRLLSTDVIRSLHSKKLIEYCKI